MGERVEGPGAGDGGRPDPVSYGRFNRRDFGKVAAGLVGVKLLESVTGGAEEAPGKKTGPNESISAMVFIMPAEQRRMLAEAKQMQAPIRAILGDENRLAGIGLLDIIDATSSLSPNALRRGDEMVWGDVLGQKLVAGGAGMNPHVAGQVRMPALHFLQSVHERYPGYFKSIGGENLAKLTVAVKDRVLVEREQLLKRPLLAEGGNMLVMLFEEAQFTPKILESLARQYRMNMVGVHGGAKAAESGVNPKADYLRDVGVLAGDRDNLALVWNFTHGHYTHGGFRRMREGAPALGLNHPDGVSYAEIAHAMVAGQVAAINKAVMEGGAAQGDINLSHMNLVLDACYQYDFARGHLYDEIFRLSGQSKLDVTGLPLVVAATQRGMPGMDFQQGEGAGQELRSPLQLAFARTGVPQGEPFTVAHLLVADQELRTFYDTLHKLEIAPMRQDMSVFGPRVVDLDEVMGKMVSDLGLPPLPEKRNPISAGRRRALEISSRMSDRGMIV